MKRDIIVPTRLSKQEHEYLKRLAGRDGQTIAAWIRAQIHKEARRHGIAEETENASIDNG
jgi:hypothetical protein